MTLLRLLIFLAVALPLATLLNFIPLRLLWRLHPALRKPLLAGAFAGNILWPLLPIVFHAPSTSWTRLLRATLAPLWCGWFAFILGELLALTFITLLWLPFSRSRTFLSFARPFSRAALVLISLIGLIGCVQALVPLDVRNVRVELRDLPAALDGFRIAQMSDLHVGLFSRMSRLQQFDRAINAAHPDVTVISGDLLDDDPYFVPKLLRGIAALDVQTPLLAVLGNHEIYGQPRDVIATLRGSRIHLLVNEGTAIRRGTATLWMAGISDFAASRLEKGSGLEPDLSLALRDAPQGSTRILLAHQPLAFALARRAHVPLTICGHTHGGQFGLKPFWSLAGVFLPFDMGLYRRGDAQLYVNTGTGYWALPFRFGMTPEITILELHTAQ